jgi:hypothetical protein
LFSKNSYENDKFHVHTLGLFDMGSVSSSTAASAEELEEPEKELLFSESEHVQSHNYNLWLILPTWAPPKEAHEGEVVS